MLRESGKSFTFPWVICPDMIPDISSRQICALTGVHPRDWCTVVAEVALVGGFHLTSDPLGFLVNVVSFLVIKRTNVVMLKLLAISRNAGVCARARRVV